MNILIIEDEARAANHLERLIHKVAPDMHILDKIETIRDAITFLQNRSDISLIFSDIQLADGLSFEIYKQINVNCPIVFTTAYDQYAIEAFTTNGIDYLLKPIEEDRLLQAIQKVKQFSANNQLKNLLTLVNQIQKKEYKLRFMVKVGDKIKSISTSNIKAFYSFDKATFLHTNSNRSYALDYTLDEIADLVDPQVFFKINRKYIVSIAACQHIIAWTNSRLKLTVEGIDDPQIIVAREKVQEFKRWLDR